MERRAFCFLVRCGAVRLARRLHKPKVSRSNRLSATKTRLPFELSYASAYRPGQSVLAEADLFTSFKGFFYMKPDPNAGSLIAPPVDEAPSNPKRAAALAKGRATQAYEKGKISTGQRAKIHSESDRAIGHTFHSHKGTR